MAKPVLQTVKNICSNVWYVMVHYIIYVYGPSWLLGKWNYLMKNGPQNFLRMAKLQKEHCTPEELEIVVKKSKD